MVTTGFSEEGQQLTGISLSGAVGAVVESVSVQGPFMASPGRSTAVYSKKIVWLFNLNLRMLLTDSASLST
jgi:hypothetical protein